MGLQDRDYMRRGSGDGDERRSSPDSKAEASLAHFLQKHPRFFLYVAVGLGALILLGLLVARLSGTNP